MLKIFSSINLSPITFCIILIPKLHGKYLSNFPISSQTYELAKYYKIVVQVQQLYGEMSYTDTIKITKQKNI